VKITKIVHLKKEPYDVYIGRGSIWGNPFSHKQNTLAKYVVPDRDTAIQKYKEWILTQPELLDRLSELKWKTLGCWCGHYEIEDRFKPLQCHGQILLELIHPIKSIF